MTKLIKEAKRFQELANINEASQHPDIIKYLGFTEDNIMHGLNDSMTFEIRKLITLRRDDFENDDMFEEFYYKAKEMHNYPKFKQFVSDYIKQRIK